MKLRCRWHCVLAVTVLVTACATPGDEPERRARSDPATLAMKRTLGGVPLSEAGWPKADWWHTLGDPQLDRLIDLAIAGSPSLAIARARLDRANAGVIFAESQLRPDAIGSLDMTYRRFSESGAFQNGRAGDWQWENRLALDLAWDLDLWGRNRAALRAAVDQAKAFEVDVFSARLALATGVARVYVELHRLHDQVDVVRAAVENRQAVLALTRKRFDAGIDSQVELTQAQAALPSARAELAAVQESIALMRNLLAALSGRGPDETLDLERPKIAVGKALVLPANLPANLIGRRPDLVAQRWRVEAAARNIEVARAQFYPNINLIGFVGFSSFGLSNLVSHGAAIAGVGPAVRLPLFDGGQLRADLAGTRADYDLAVEQYNQTLLDAVREVADQVTSLRALAARRAEQSRALEGFRKGYDLALLRYREGLGNYLQVLDAEAQLLRERRTAADLEAREIDLSIGLVRALGGGFE